MPNSTPSTPTAGTAPSGTGPTGTALTGTAADTGGSSEAPTSTRTGTNDHLTTADRPGGDAAARRTRAGELEDRVWAALRRHPGATAAELTSEASGSRSAVGKLLATWAADGSATSTAGPKPRDARRWTAAPMQASTPSEPCTGPGAEPRNDSGPSAAHPDAADTAVNTASGDDHTPDTVRRGPDHEADPVAPRAAAGDPAPAGPRRTAAANHSDARSSDVDGAVLDHPEVDGAEFDGRRIGEAALVSEPARGRELGGARAATRNRSGSTRLPKGGLRGQVEDYLSDAPGEHSPVQIGKVLGRSSGAIANALESLVELGDAVRTSERPRRYSHPDHADAVDQSTRHAGRDSATADHGRTRARGPGRGVCGVGTYVTVLAVLPLDSVDAISTDEIADWVCTRVPAPVLFAGAAHGVTRAALSAGAEPADWPSTTTDSTTEDTEDDVAAGPNAPFCGDASGPDAADRRSEDPDGQLDAADDATTGGDTVTDNETPSDGEEPEGDETDGDEPDGDATDGHGAAEAGDRSARVEDGGDRPTRGVAGEQSEAAAPCGGEA